MKQTIYIIAALALLVAAAGAAYAYPVWSGNASGASNVMLEQHEAMENIMENGTYQDLVDYREATGYNVMPWVDDEQAFEQMQEQHSQIAGTQGYGHGMMGRRGSGSGFGGCPMMDRD